MVDALNRLVDANRNGTNLQDWTLDSLGNWSGTTIGTTSQTRTADAANQITNITGGWVTPVYDAAGNMTTMPKSGAETTALTAIYDAWNHLIELSDTGGTIATYEYDGQGRRIEKTTGGDTLDYFWNESYQNIETRKNNDADPIDQTIYDIRYIDSPLVRFHDANTDGDYADGGDNVLYPTSDANFDVTATVNAGGSVANRFVYTPYGQRTVLTATWTAGTTNFDLGHQGLMFDAESGLYYNRARYLHATLGTFTVRDPLGYVDGGDVYQYVRSSPIGGVDPMGLAVAQANRPFSDDFQISEVTFNLAQGYKYAVTFLFNEFLGTRWWQSTTVFTMVNTITDQFYDVNNNHLATRRQNVMDISSLKAIPDRGAPGVTDAAADGLAGDVAKVEAVTGKNTVCRVTSDRTAVFMLVANVLVTGINGTKWSWNGNARGSDVISGEQWTFDGAKVQPPLTVTSSIFGFASCDTVFLLATMPDGEFGPGLPTPVHKGTLTHHFDFDWANRMLRRYSIDITSTDPGLKGVSRQGGGRLLQ